MRTNLLDTIVRTENLFPQLFADVEKRDWGVLFVTPAIPDSHDGNHACVLDSRCNPVAVVDEIVAFYAERGLTPRVNYLAATDSPALRKALEGAGFTFGDGDTMQVYVYQGPSRIAANPEVRVRRIETVDATTFSALRAIGNLRSAKIIERCALRADTWLFVGEIDGQVSSVALLERLGSICRVDEVATAQQHRRKGCARAVIHTLVDYYEKHLSDPMYVWTDNPVAERIYAEAGFAKIDHSLISWHAWRERVETRTVERERSHVFGEKKQREEFIFPE